VVLVVVIIAVVALIVWLKNLFVPKYLKKTARKEGAARAA
jgi:hypothetical protein